MRQMLQQAVQPTWVTLASHSSLGGAGPSPFPKIEEHAPFISFHANLSIYTCAPTCPHPKWEILRGAFHALEHWISVSLATCLPCSQMEENYPWHFMQFMSDFPPPPTSPHYSPKMWESQCFTLFQSNFYLPAPQPHPDSMGEWENTTRSAVITCENAPNVRQNNLKSYGTSLITFELTGLLVRLYAGNYGSEYPPSHTHTYKWEKMNSGYLTQFIPTPRRRMWSLGILCNSDYRYRDCSHAR